MITLDEALDRLLHLRSYRRAFLEWRYRELDLSNEDLVALSTIDREQLVRTAERVIQDLLARRHCGSGGLLELYPRTLEAWNRSRPEDESFAELMATFLESAAFQGYRQVPFAGLGWSLEEAFFAFCESAEIGDPITREREFLAAMLRALAVCPTAAFRIPDCVHRAAAGWFAISRRGTPILYAAARGRFMTGTITPFLAELLEEDRPAEVARRHGVPAAVLDASLSQLEAMGLLPS